jgi:hypothetical protein
MQYTIRLPEPHAKQRQFMRSKAKRKLVCAGRRGGKTTGMAILAIESALAGRRILEAAPTSDQTTAFWDACKAALVEPITAKKIYVNNSERLMIFPNGGRIRAKTAWDANTLRGDHADLLILDEYSIMDESAWGEVGAPMLLDNNGDAVFIFTPKSRNHAYRLYQRAVVEDDGRWEAFHFTSMDNPHLSEEALAEITSDMTEDAYRQEILAEFLENSGTVFRNIAACTTLQPSTPDKHNGHTLIAGVDLAKQKDYTTISIGCLECKEEVAIDRFNQIDYLFQIERIKSICKKWNITTVIVDSTGVGSPILEQLQRDLYG